MLLGLPLILFRLTALVFRLAMRGHHFADSSADAFGHFGVTLFTEFDHLTFDRLHRGLHDLVDACPRVAGDLVNLVFNPLDRVSAFFHRRVHPLLAQFPQVLSQFAHLVGLGMPFARDLLGLFT